MGSQEVGYTLLWVALSAHYDLYLVPHVQYRLHRPGNVHRLRPLRRLHPLSSDSTLFSSRNQKASSPTATWQADVEIPGIQFLAYEREDIEFTVLER